MNFYNLKEFNKWLESQKQRDYLVKVAYKYSFDARFHIENIVLEYDSNNNCYVWTYDFLEGHEDVFIIACAPIEDIDVFRENILYNDGVIYIDTDGVKVLKADTATKLYNTFVRGSYL